MRPKRHRLSTSLPQKTARSDEMTRFIYALKEIRACLEGRVRSWPTCTNAPYGRSADFVNTWGSAAVRVS
jgi:hypothetical protein